MIEGPIEEKKKDEILQQINDELERLDWGDNCKKLVMKIVFDGRFNMRPIRSFKNYKTEDSETVFTIKRGIYKLTGNNILEKI